MKNENRHNGKLNGKEKPQENNTVLGFFFFMLVLMLWSIMHC